MRFPSPLFDPRPAASGGAMDAIPLVDDPLPDHTMRPLRTPTSLASGNGHQSLDGVPIVDRPRAGDAGAVPPAIRPLDPSFVDGDPSASWKRRPAPGTRGAWHVRTFHARLCPEAISFMDQQINEWLDQHPECEVKHVTTSVGEWTGKGREPHLVCQIWV